MTRKDYVAIAAALNACRYHPDDGAETDWACCDIHARAIADVMARDNPRFDRARFLKACGVQS
jgi:hypothetical protein